MNQDQMLRVSRALIGAKGIAFDGCHKIYILLDDEQMEHTLSTGYGKSETSYLHWLNEVIDPLNTIAEWYDDSCSLRFVQSIRTAGTDPNAGFSNVIPQFEDEDEDGMGWSTY
jgi:hypothetical protein